MKNTGWFALSLFLGLAGLGLSGCHQEPPIVVKFEPNDLKAAPAPAVDSGAAPSSHADLGRADAAKPAAEAVPPTHHGKAECRVAADCTVAPADCCDCANGGKEQAVPKHAEAKLKAARAKRCKGVMCTMMLSTDPTCGKRADCVEGRCVLAEKPASEKGGALQERLKAHEAKKK